MSSKDSNFKPLSRGVSMAQADNREFTIGLSRGQSLAFNTETGEIENSQTLWDDSSFIKFGRNRGRTMDRANSFVGNASSNRDEAIVVVDPFSTGAQLAAEVCRRGFKCIKVLSLWDSPVAALVQQGLMVDYHVTIQHNSNLPNQNKAIDDTVKTLLDIPIKILAVVAGAETGVELADQLSSRMGLRTNGIDVNNARRNKYHMGEAVRRSGVRAVKQALITKPSELQEFLKTFDENFKCILKPVQSAGSDDIFLCSSFMEAQNAFNHIFGKINGLGILNTAVLAQEFLEGKEYVIDQVSRDGVHKIVAIWEYDKRRVNGSNFVYFGYRLKPAATEASQSMIAYAQKILNALNIVNGPSHMEVMLKTIYDADGKSVLQYDPCLVEVGARCHGFEGTWLRVAHECIGYTQVNVTLDAYLEGKLFDSIPSTSYILKKAGREVDIVSHYGGIVRGFPGEEVIRKLPSFRSLSWDIKPGDYCHKTVDCFTRAGCVQLVHDSEEVADQDFDTIHEMEKLGLIDYSVICPVPPSIGAIVVVDPFSTGANLAAMVLKWGYKLILVFSEQDSPVAKLVAKGTSINPTLLIQHDNSHPDQDFAIEKTIQAITGDGSPILAIIPGAETGVELADRISSRYGTRTNGEENTEVRRNKYLMQEAVKARGVRAMEQKLCLSESEVLEFIEKIKKLSPSGLLKCVVKPNESAGSDSIFLCTKPEEALLALHAIHGKTNGLGQINDGALCQEFLSGTEFVVDGVSRDGVYKVTAVWEYDKRSVNGANFVYFGMSLRDCQHPEIKALIEYSKLVLKALGILNGPSHMEVMSIVHTSPDGASPVYAPCLVEVGSRCHGGEATWMPVAMECIGYSQVDVTLNCYLRPDRFEALPFEPTLQAAGSEAFLVSHQNGLLKDIPGLDTIRKLPSFRRIEMLTQPGGPIYPTVDCFTRPGSVQLVNKSKEDLMKDYAKVRELEVNGMFELDNRIPKRLLLSKSRNKCVPNV